MEPEERSVGAEPTGGLPRHTWAILAAVLATGLLASIGVWYLSRLSEARQEQVRFERAVQQSVSTVHDQIADYDEVLYGLRGSIVIEPALSREDFHFAVEGSGALQRLPAFNSVQWVVPVRRDGQVAFEQRSGSEQVPGFDRLQVQVHPPMKDPVNYVIDYVEPLAQNSYAVGLNLSALPGRSGFIERARDSGSLVTTQPFSLVLAQGEKPGFVVFLPVYDPPTVPQRRAERRAKFRGVIGGVFVAEDMLADMAPEGQVSGYAIYDIGATGAAAEDPKLVYATQPGLDPAQAQESVEMANGDRRWNVYFFQSDAGQGSVLPWLLLLAGLALTGLSMAYVYATARARSKAEDNARQIAESERRLLELSMTDPLTGLANRRRLIARLEDMARSAAAGNQSLTIMYLDVDSFKSVNDTHGHGVGDDLLVEVGRRLAAVATPRDAVGRLSGDEFSVGFLVSSRDEAMAGVARFHEAMNAPYELPSGILPVRVSIGVVVVQDADQGIKSLLDAADEAMYEAKARGGGEVVWFDDEIARRAEADTQCTLWLRGAVDDGAFTLHYQPVFDLATGRVVAAEALLRLQPPDGDLIMPGRFLECAERANLMRPLGLQVIRRAVQERAGWQEEKPDSDLVVTINLSASQAADPETLSVFSEALQQWDLPARLFALEMTETDMFGASSDTSRFLAEATALGVPLCIDDFGVGYSNLQALTRLDAQVLKIDQSLVRQLPADPRIQQIVGSLAGMAPELDLRLVAEGIETAEQLAAVGELGIPMGQGFLLARPRESLREAAESAHATQLRP